MNSSNEPSEKSNYRYSYEIRMKTGVLLLLNSPKLMKFGIDLSEWTVGSKFMGIKLIPIGTHYISFSLSDEKYEAKQGLFITISSDNLITVRSWSNEYQTFIPLKEEEEKNFKIGINNLDFDKNLGDYPIEQEQNWKDLSKYISLDVVNKLQPEHRKFLTERKEYEDKGKDNNYIVGDINYTNFNNKIYSLKEREVTHEELTKINIDKSNYLYSLIQKEFNDKDNELLGEFQFSFISFLIGENYESLLQWRNLIALLSSCEKAINEKQKLFCSFVEILYHQLRNFPKDLFYDEIIGNNFLKRYLEYFLSNEDNKSLNQDFLKRISLFKRFLKEHFNYEVENEEKRIIDNYLNNYHDYYNNDIDDDLPVIVDQKEIEHFQLRQNKNKMELDE